MDFAGKLERAFDWRSQALVAFGFAAVVLVGLVDYWTGEELSVLVLYLGPITLVAWMVNRTSGVILASASAVAWLSADLATKHHYGQGFIPYWNAAMLLCSFLIIANLVSALKVSYSSLEKKVEERTAALQQANRELSQSREDLVRALEDLKRSHAELKATQLQLIQAAKFESIGQLAAGVAHEVKNPLMVITMVADYLGNYIAPKDEESKGMLRDMQEAIKKANTVIGELLDFSRPKELLLKPDDIHGMVESTLGMVKLELTRNRVAVTREFAPSLPKLFLDKNKMEQVFLNLFMNAIQAMPAGGTLTIRTFAAQREASGLNAPDEPKGTAKKRVIVEIDDTGVGIPESNLPKLFDPFFTTKAPGQGTGLGLSVVRQIVEMHGGHIEIHNRAEGGVRASLTFLLPEK